MTRPASTLRLPDGPETYAGRTLRVDHRSVSRRTAVEYLAAWEAGSGAEEWGSCSRTVLSRDYPADSDVWRWLAAHGVERVSLSGPSGKRVAPRGERVEWVPSSEAARAAIGTLAERWGCSRGVAIDEALLRAVAQNAT